LSTGYRDIFGAYWVNCTQGYWAKLYQLPREKFSSCKGRVFADVYHVAMPDEASKPYSSDVMNIFVQADAVDWTTRSFRKAKLSFVREFLTAFGNGLNESQKSSSFRILRNLTGNFEK
jgi:hypothetical protein